MEPPLELLLSDLNKKDIIKKIELLFSQQRLSLIKNKIAICKISEGKIVDNNFSCNYSETGLRQSVTDNGIVCFDKTLDNNFNLIIKYPNVFTAILPILKTKYPCYAIIRNPLAVLLSWNSISAPVRNGRAPFIENFDSELKNKLLNESDEINRQLILLSWYFERYQKNLPEINIIKYEDIISSKGRALSVVVSSALKFNYELENKNFSQLYKTNTNINYIANKLLNSQGFYWNFYSRSEVYTLLQYFVKDEN